MSIANAAHHSMMGGKKGDIKVETFGKTLGEGSLSNANGSIIPFKNLTISCWYRSVRVGAIQWETIWQVETGTGFGFYFDNSNRQRLRLVIQNRFDGQVATIPTPTTWHHYALAVGSNGLDYKVYVDGSLTYSGVISLAIAGYNQIYLLRAVDGLMCKPIIWGVELSPEEIVADYNSKNRQLVRYEDISSFWPGGIINGVLPDIKGNRSVTVNSRYYNSTELPW